MAPSKPVDKSSKVIFVTVIDDEVNTQYDIVLQKRIPDKDDTNDLEKIADILKRISKALKHVFLSCENFSFQKESELRPNNWVVIGDDSPVKDRSEVRCVVKKPKFDFSSVEAIDQLSGIQDEEPNLSIVRHSTALLGDAPSLNLSLPEEDTSQNSYFIKQTTEKQVQPPKRKTACITSSDSNSEESDDGQRMYSQMFTVERVNRESVRLNSASTEKQVQPLKRKTACITSSDSNSEESDDGQRIYSQLFTVSERVNRECVRLNSALYKLPTCYGTALTQKMNSKEKQTYQAAEFSMITRTLASSIEAYTLHPHPDSLKFVVDSLLVKYPNLIMDKEDSMQTNTEFLMRIQRNFEYRRGKNNQQYSKKGGRVPTKKSSTDDQSPTAEILSLQNHRTSSSDVVEVDMVSYQANVAKLIDVCRSFGDKKSVKYLWKLTFEGRRKAIVSNQFDNINHLLKTACPVLSQPEYLHGEFEMVKGVGICRKFFDNWTACVPVILKYAIQTMKKDDAVSKVFAMYGKETLTQFETKACIALEILPLLLPVRNRKGVVAANFLFNVQEETTNLETLLKKTVNRPPYILNIGDTHHVVVDNDIFMTSHCVSEALLNMFAAYYVFYIQYSREVKLSLLFIQSKIFELQDSETSKIQKLTLFARNLEIVKDQMDAKKKKS